MSANLFRYVLLVRQLGVRILRRIIKILPECGRRHTCTYRERLCFALRLTLAQTHQYRARLDLTEFIGFGNFIALWSSPTFLPRTPSSTTCPGLPEESHKVHLIRLASWSALFQRYQPCHPMPHILRCKATITPQSSTLLFRSLESVAFVDQMAVAYSKAHNVDSYGESQIALFSIGDHVRVICVFRSAVTTSTDHSRL